MTRKKAFETLKANLCGMCAYGSQCMESCDIRSCDNRDAIKTLEQEFCCNVISRQAVLNKIKEVCFSPEKEWREFRASYGTRGQIGYITNYIKTLSNESEAKHDNHS